MTDPKAAPQSVCQFCGEPMPEGEEMFKFHGYSGDCPKPPLPKAAEKYAVPLTPASAAPTPDAFAGGGKPITAPTPDWWCHTCGMVVPPDEVTFNEAHDMRAGGCGMKVGTRPASAAPTPETDALLHHVAYERMKTPRLLTEITAFARQLERRLASAQKKIDQLRLISNVNGDWTMKYQNMCARAEEAERKLAEAEKDAERWRSGYRLGFPELCSDGWIHELFPDAFFDSPNSTIDAAIDKEE